MKTGTDIRYQKMLCKDIESLLKINFIEKRTWKRKKHKFVLSLMMAVTFVRGTVVAIMTVVVKNFRDSETMQY